ncbi:hypothetical protein [Aeromonas sp.]|uniref:type IV toxin-antitoxin system AbiEi family antitoxin n=1 Tax=Aeromonas sp. TaxID=647 RepID=UPI00258AEE8E|nr:hypothetical protein [Aeromonas sp.]MCX7129593.1 hypothetical protein [Aeromonas sp.]
MVDKHSTQQMILHGSQYGDRTGIRDTPKTKQRLSVYSVLEKLHGVKLEEEEPVQPPLCYKNTIRKVIIFGYYVFMKSSELLKQLRHFDREHDYWLYMVPELALLFPDEKPQQLKNSLVRQCKAGHLLKVGGGLYAWPDARSLPMYRLEHLIQRLRPRELSYISLESALSMHGWISQIPLAVLTVMTTGRSYLQQTAYGLIEWTHTEQSATTILNGTVWDPMRECLIARPVQAYRDIRRVGRNLDLVIPHQEKNEVSDKI